jgi:hypothetical protein
MTTRRLVIINGNACVTQRMIATKKIAIAFCPSGVRPSGVGILITTTKIMIADKIANLRVRANISLRSKALP